MGQRTFPIARLVLYAAAIFAMPAARADLSTGSSAPFYTASSIVHAATQTSQALAPNTVATVYGTNLSYTTHAVATADLNNGALPTTVEGVNVYVYGIRASIFFVSPGQINFLIPYELTALAADIIIVRQGVAGPAVTIPTGKDGAWVFRIQRQLRTC